MRGIDEQIHSEDGVGDTLAEHERDEVAARLRLDRTRGAAGIAQELSAADLARWSDDAIRQLVSTRAYQQTVDWETGGRAYYEKRLMAPCWPGARSGVTIGVGYDLGYHSRDEVRAAWGGRLPEPDIYRLIGVIGFRTDGSDAARSGKVAQAHRLVESLKDIRIPWEVAESVFVDDTVPKYARLVLQHLANAKDLHPDSFGALFSLVFNRGPSFALTGERYREMRAIGAAMASRSFDQVPIEIRQMRRIWSNGPAGLLKRREGEAKLFEDGLGAMTAAAPVRALASEPAPASRLSAESREGIPVDDDSAASDVPPPPHTYRGPSFELSDVQWPADDGQTPDYAHLVDRSLARAPYNFTADDFELLLKANRFNPRRDRDRVLFGLRGARLAGDERQVEVDQLRLVDARPDHRHYRCVIGVYVPSTRKLSGFVASTVPAAKYVLRGWQKFAAGEKEFFGNLLSTGCYPYVIGAHVASRHVPGCFLQGTSADKRESVCVLRTLKDVRYDLGDHWDRCEPHDNLHPGFSLTTFSSVGCQTVQGTFQDGAFTGDFAALKQATGAPGTSGARARYDYVLLTGLEAAIAADLRVRGLGADDTLVTSSLARLRQGSTGDEVRRLQAALNRPATGILDSADRLALIEHQMLAGVPSDGIYAPAMDKALALQVFTGVAPPVQTPVQTVVAERADLTNPRIGERDVAPFLAADDESLYAEIGLRARLAGQAPETAGALRSAAAPESSSARAASGTLGRDIFHRLEDQLYDIVCGRDPMNDDIRQKLNETLASKLGTAEESSAITALASLMIIHLGLIPPIAVPIAVLVITRILKSSYENGCQMWGADRLRRGPTRSDAAAWTEDWLEEQAALRRERAPTADRAMRMERSPVPSRLAALSSWGCQMSELDPAKACTVPYELLVIDPCREEDTRALLARETVDALKVRPDGARRVVIAYLSIGEAESYRYYWDKAAWKPMHAPSFLLGANKDPGNPWVSNYTVRFWDPSWQEIICGGESSFLARIQAAGFDGVYLDKCDVIWNLEDWYKSIYERRPTIEADMVAFIARIKAAGRARDPQFMVIMQNAEDLLARPELRAVLDGVAKEELLFSGGRANRKSEIAKSIGFLTLARNDGLGVFCLEYLNDDAKIALAVQTLRGLGFVPYTADVDRLLKKLRRDIMASASDESTPQRAFA